MNKFDATIESIHGIIENAKSHEIVQTFTSQDNIQGNRIKVNNKEVINFGSCSYLGLEFDERLKNGAIEAIRKFGTQFSSSRSYVSLGLYHVLEQLFCEIFKANCIVTPTTTLGHIAAIPILVSDQDAVIIDHQAHNSISTAVSLLKPRNIHVELLRHNKMDELDAKINRLKSKYKNIWYMADGIYSMYGDSCPLEDIENLLIKYPQFHAYIDDAHGMSWCGKKGEGYVLSRIGLHERMVVVASLAKSFAACGGVLIFPNKSMEKRVRNCGGPLMFSGPLQPANLGTAIASAKIHLNEEIQSYQRKLFDNIKYTSSLIKEIGLPCISLGESPVFFIGVSLPKIGYAVIERLINKGYYVNIGIYPAVPLKNTGIRFTITRLHNKKQIKSMLFDLKEILDTVIVEQNFSYDNIYRAFKRDFKYQSDGKIESNKKELTFCRYQSIVEVDRQSWNELFDSKGIINYEALLLLERSFSKNPKKENNYDFEYIIIKDNQQKIILATFLCISLCKEDMMYNKEISIEIEKIRQFDPYYLTSQILSVGIPITEGEQMYLDQNHPLWSDALNQLLEWMSRKQLDKKINQLIIRDFEQPTAELEKVFLDNGFVKCKLPNNNHIDNFDWHDTSEFIQLLSKKNRRHFRKNIDRNYYKFKIRENNAALSTDIEHWYELYLNVKRKNLSINTFDLPIRLFHQIAEDKDWKVIEFFPKKDFVLADNEQKPVAFCMIHLNGTTANGAILGMDYAYQKEYRIYNCILHEIILFTKRKNLKRLNLGYTSDVEKRKMGAKQSIVYSFMQVQDDFNLRVLSERAKIKEPD
ncbi:MAG: aminotransferase class I/II-fold pyridoxal phosphate-dependent enzyme [Bacteroidota bacterium]